jgi:PIN domain nuclease of toxin-antitoxin system
MPLLLDTHAFAWWALEEKRLSRTASNAIREHPEIYLSAVVTSEISGKVRIGKWPEARVLFERFFETLRHYGMRPLPITLEHAHLAGSLASAHRDPFDRMLAAQATIEHLTLVTADPAFQSFDVTVLW